MKVSHHALLRMKERGVDRASMKEALIHGRRKALDKDRVKVSYNHITLVVKRDLPFVITVWKQ